MCMTLFCEIFTVVFKNVYAEILTVFYACLLLIIYVITYGVIITVVMHDSTLWNIYCVCVRLYSEILSVDVYDSIMWNMCLGFVCQYIVKYFLWFCMTVNCEKITVVVY